MTTLAAVALTTGLFVFTMTAATATAGRQSQPPSSGEGLPDAPGKEATAKVCGACHEARRAASVRLTRDGWTGVIDRMTKLGAQGTPDELAAVLDYLSTNFPGEAAQPLNVNTASRVDLEAVAGLLRREAAAVIAFRDKNGKFKTVEDLKKVPGLDFKKIESRRDFIVAM